MLNDIVIRPADIEGGIFLVHEVGREITGVAGVMRTKDGYELAHLWVEPGRIGSGIGRALLRAAADRAGKAGARELTFTCDPHTEGFYLRMGARRIGERESEAVPGRDLPRMRLDLTTGPDDDR